MSRPGFQQYQSQFTGHIRDPKGMARPQGVALRGMKAYTEIVFNNMAETLAACFPVTQKVLGARRWMRLVRAFLAEHRCVTPLFRQIPEELLHYLEQAPDSLAGLPPFLYSLAHYEWIELALSLSDATLPPGEILADGDLLNQRPVLAPALALLSYPYQVQRIGPCFRPTQPDAEPTNILAFRRLDDDVKFIVLNPVSARLVALLEAGATGMAALQQIAMELKHSRPEVVVQGGLEILKNLREEQAIWGAWGHENAETDRPVFKAG